MSSVPMPRDLSEEAVARWVASTRAHGFDGPSGLTVLGSDRTIARAVLTLLRAKVREAAQVTSGIVATGRFTTFDAIVARVMGEEVRRG